MIAWLQLLLALPAFAQDEAEPEVIVAGRRPPIERDRKPLQLVPVRVDTRAAIRDGFGTGVVLELGVQALRRRHLQLDVNGAATTPRQLLVPAPWWRTTTAWEASADALLPATKWLAVGPTGGGAVRLFGQQGRNVGTLYVSFVGLRANTTLIAARKWSVAVSSRVTTDLVIARLVLDTQQVVPMSPVEAQVGLRVLLGHGRLPEEAP